MRELSSSAREVLRAARSGGRPTAADQARVKAQLDARLADPHLVEPNLGPLNPSPAGLGGVAAGAAVVAGAAAVWLATAPPARPVDPLVAPPTSTPAPFVQLRVQPAGPSAAEAEARAEASTRGASPRAAVRAPSAVEAPSASPELGRTPPSTPTAQLAAEAALVRRAQAAVRDEDWARALALTEEHRAAFASGVLIEERLVLEAVAACGAGDAEREIRARSQLRRDHPESVHGARIERACEAR